MTVYRELSCQKVGHVMIVQLQGSTNVPGRLTRIGNDLEDLCDEVNWDDDVRVTLLSYEGKDVDSATGDTSPWGAADPSSLVKPIARLRQPVIAAIVGDALGIGLELALACDIRIGTEGARFGLTHVVDGLIPSAGGTQRLPRLIGPGKALEMILTGEAVDALEARRIGLMHRVFLRAELMDRAKELAQDMAARSPLAMCYVKEALHGGLDLTIDQGMRMELDLYLLLFTTQDRTEGITAFREKRKPVFDGV